MTRDMCDCAGLKKVEVLLQNMFESDLPATDEGPSVPVEEMDDEQFASSHHRSNTLNAIL